MWGDVLEEDLWDPNEIFYDSVLKICCSKGRIIKKKVSFATETCSVAQSNYE